MTTRTTAVHRRRRTRARALNQTHPRVLGPTPRLGWLLNMVPTTFQRGDSELAGLELFLLSKDAKSNFRVTIAHAPYFYVAVALKFASFGEQVRSSLARRFEVEGCVVEAVTLEDLDAPNHVAGAKRTYLKLSFDNVRELMNVKRELAPVVWANRDRFEAEARSSGGGAAGEARSAPEDVLDMLDEIREYDVPYYMRAAIDLNIRVGAWHTVSPDAAKGGGDEDAADGADVAGAFQAVWQQDVIEKPAPRVLAFDIECTKAPLKFPNADVDEVFMISYMVDGVGYLIISREVVSEDIDDFEYTPKPAFPGPFSVFNEPDELALLKKFINHCKEIKPHVFVTYNGDFFDWPFLANRCEKHGISLQNELGIENKSHPEQGEWRGRAGCVHLDCFAWVKRDSYLPQGSQGLKAVTKYKLGYDPVEVDPEDMVKFAHTQPNVMAAYSVSDAVATYYLYEVYVNLFIFSLCTVIPNGAEDVLRKGSGTLCEALLMVEAYRASVVCPNKQNEPHLLRKEGRVVESETYVGGHVESLESGVFRSDIATHFSVDPAALETLIANVDRDLEFHAKTEGGGATKDQVANFADVRAQIVASLQALRDAPETTECPKIYHLDVSAMYPNIILTNRLQPTAIVDRAACAGCDYNQDRNGCKRPMDWIWRGELNPAAPSEVAQLNRQLQYEVVDGTQHTLLSKKDQAQRLKARLKDYSQKVYKKTREVKEEPRTDVVCMRENSFYVDTVRAFRDRRYEYKGLTKAWKKKRVKAEAAKDSKARKTAEDKELLFDSLQLAHKCILNSFYGYVMRKGARWRSMPMAGIVTLTGANLITQARELVEKVGRPLELDTDGIWCMLPSSFPEDYTLEIVGADGSTSKLPFSYPCGMLNADVHANYTNHQMQTLNGAGGFDTTSECSIFFEVDGPYKCMVIPSSTEEGKLLKKRYAVFNPDGTLAELKGFELKRRGELELIKAFQGELFDTFLAGDTLESCYAAVADVANAWLDVMDAKGGDMDDEELLDLISENRSLSREVKEYEGRKMTSLTTAQRIADFLGDDMIQGSGLQCKLVISERPRGTPVTERAVPTIIFSAEPAVRKHYLRKWLKDPAAQNLGIKDVIDWKYYRERLDAVIRKIITIPAALQGVENPVPRVPHPEWLRKKVAERDDGRKQTKIDDLFSKAAAKENDGTKRRKKLLDLEDIAGGAPAGGAKVARRIGTPGAGKQRKRPLGANAPEAPAPEAELCAGKDAPQLGLAAKKVPEADFRAWLADRKRRWRRRRAKATASTATKAFRSRPGALAAPKKGPGKRLNVSDLVKQSTRSLTRGTWRVLELRDTETPGLLNAFVVTDVGHLQRVAVSVAKTLYVASSNEACLKIARETFGGRKAPNLTVPGDELRRGAQLLELRAAARDVDAHDGALARFLHHPGLDGVYERLAPDWYRSLLSVGGTCRLAPSAAKATEARLAKGAQSVAAEDLELADLPVSEGYGLLDDGPGVPVKVCYLYHSVCARTGRCLVGLAMLERSKDDGSLKPALASLVLGDPKAKKGDRPPALKRTWDVISGRDDADDGETSREFGPLTVDRAEVAKHESSALAAASTALASYAADRRGPTVVIVESSSSAASLRRSLPSLGDFANVEVPFREADCDYPLLGWQSHACKALLEGIARVPGWLAERRTLGAFGNVPLGNLGAAPLVTVADAVFGRELRKHRHVLWASEADAPDLGGPRYGSSSIGDDDDELPIVFRDFHRVGSVISSRSKAQKADAPSTSKRGVVEHPGAYRTVSVKLDVFGSCVNAVMVSDALDDAGDLDDGGGWHATHGECAHAFRVLRAALAAWIDDVAAKRDPVADALLVHVDRWLHDKRSVLHYPALRRLVGSATRRVHALLVAELRRLGVKVVHASEGSIVVNTREADAAHAASHMDFVISTVAARPVFRFLHLRPVAYFKSLLWLDGHNFGAIEILGDDEEESSTREKATDEDESQEAAGAAEAPEEPDAREALDSPEAADSQGQVAKLLKAPAAVQDRFVSEWALSDGLPDAARDWFAVLVGAFLHKPLVAATGDEERDAEYARDFVQSFTTSKLLSVVAELHKDFLHTSVPLDFVVLCCRALALDDRCDDAVQRARRLLLAHLGVREFAPAAAIKPRPIAVNVANVICPHCDATLDVDLHACKGRDLRNGDARELDDKGDPLPRCVPCAKCGGALSTAQLELKLIELVNAVSVRYAVQDMRCCKCKRVARTTMRKTCECAGEYVTDIDTDKLNDYFRVVNACAGHYDMLMLAEITAFFLPEGGPANYL